MKPQDILFIAMLIILLWKRNPQWFIVAGLISLTVAIPLFSFWVFFTAQRLTYYAACFFLIGVVIMLFQEKGKKKL